MSFRKTKRKKHNKERKEDWLEKPKKKQVILTGKANCPDQIAINLTSYQPWNA